MIAIISTDETYRVMEQLNRRNFWSLSRITSTSEKEVLRAIEQDDSIDYIVVDIEGLKGNIDSAIDTIDRLHNTTSAQIVVIANGFEKGCAIERDIRSIGIPTNNIVFAEHQTELKARLLEVLPRTTRPSPIEQPVQSLQAHPSTKTIENSPRFEDAKIIPSRADRATMKQFQLHKPITKTTKAVTVGVAGAGGRVGTTTQAMQIAWYLKALEYSVAIIELSGKNHLQRMVAELGGQIIDGNHFELRNLDIYSSSRAILEAKQNYSYVVFDYGDYAAVPDAVSYLEKDIKIICCGYKPWEADALIDSVFDTDDGSINYIFFAVPHTQEPQITDQMADAGNRTYFANWAPDLMQYCGDDDTYKSILTGILPAKEKAANHGGFFFFSKKKNAGAAK